MEDAQVQALLNETLTASTLDAQLEVDEAYSAGLNAVISQGLLKQVFKMVNENKFDSYQVKDKKVIESLVKDLHLNKTNKNDPKFKFVLKP